MRHPIQTGASWLMFGLVAVAGLSLSTDPAGLSARAAQDLETSGVKNPVTAVLLNYRGYDTLLEIGVLLLVLVALWSLRAPFNIVRAPHYLRPTLKSLVRLVVPMMLLGAGYILWIGAFAPGGAFQAGAILGGALILLVLAGLPRIIPTCHHRGLLGLGLFAFLAAAIAPLLLGDALLQYPVAQAKTIILVIEAAATLSIGLTLAALFVGSGPKRGGEVE